MYNNNNTNKTLDWFNLSPKERTMKRYIILTSVIALAACGGGSGGGGVPTRQAVSDEAVQSNKKITSMASEILVGADGSIITPSMSRSSTVRYNGQDYTSYRLDDVTFKMGGEDSLVKFELDENGKIIALGKYDRSDDFTGDPTYALSEEGRFERTSDAGFEKTLYSYGISETELDYTNGVSEIVSAHFHHGIDFMNDNDNLSTAAIKERLLAKLRRELDKLKASQPDDSNDAIIEDAYTTYAARINAMTSFGAPESAHATLTIEGVDKGLRYADLGFAKLTIVGEGESYTPYVGGYDSIKIDPSALPANTTFTGTVIAGIDHKQTGEDDAGALVRQDDATLTMNTNGHFELVMDNLAAADSEHTGHWYTLTVAKDADGAPTFTVGGTNTITGFDLPTGTQTVSFAASDWQAYDQQYAKHTDDNHRVGGSAEANVYGINPNDPEATSRFGFSEEYHSNDNTVHNEVAIYGAFGGKAD